MIGYSTKLFRAVLAILMPLLLLSNFCPKAVGCADDESETRQKASELVWKTGDRLPGKAIGFASNRLKFDSPLFREPLEIDVDWLTSFDNFLNSGEQKATSKEPFAIQLIDGQLLFGDIDSLDDQFLGAHSQRAGKFKVKRSRIASIVNREASQTVVSGAIDLDDWEAKRGDKRYWKPNDDAELVATRDNIHLFLESKLPESCLIDFEIAWDEKLDFAVALGIPYGARSLGSVPRLESWDGSIVFSHDDDFEIVMVELDETAKSLKLLIHWNQKTNMIVIHDESGAELARAKIENMGRKTEPGIFLLNKAGDFRVRTIGVRSAVVGFDPSKTSIQLKSDDAINATVKSFDGQNWTATQDGKSVDISVDEFVGAFQFNPDAKYRKPSGDAIRFSDGERVIGRLTGLSESSLTVETDSMTEPLELTSTGLKQIRFEQEEKADKEEEFNHVLLSDAGKLRGRLESGQPTDANVLFWRVAGAKRAVPFASSIMKGSEVNAKVVLERTIKEAEVESKWPDTLFLNNRDWLPIKLLSAKENEIVVDSFFENTVIPGSKVRAVEFGTAAQGYGLDFSDPGWVSKNKSKATLSDNSFDLKSGAVIGHPNLMGRGGFSFDVDWSNQSYGVLNVHCGRSLNSKGEISDKETQSFAIMLYAQNFFVNAVGESQNPGQNIQTRGSGSVGFKVAIEKDRMVVYGNGKKCYSKKITTGFGRSVSIELKDMWNRNITCELENLELADGFLSGEFIDSERKELVLTIPRLKARNPPGHILCATNFDLARGDIVSLNDDFIKFRTDGSVNRYPRDILGSIIWLDTEELVKSLVQQDSSAEDGDIVAAPEREDQVVESTTQKSKAGQVAQVLMRGGRRVTLDLKKWEEEKLLGHSELLGNCAIPFDEIYEIRMGKFATQATDVPWSDWVAKLAPKPKLAGDGGPGDSGSTIFGSESPLIGKSPKLKLEMLDGSKVNLESLQGKVVVIDFWATWCGPCVKSMPQVKRVIDSYPDSSVEFVTVNQGESKQKITGFLESREWDLSVALDDGDVSDEFLVEAIPQTVIIDQQGVIRFVKVGVSNDLQKKLKEAIDFLLNSTKELTQN